MKFKITRTSEWNEKSPCEEAKQGMGKVYDERTCTEEYFDLNLAKHYNGLKWKERGSEHTVLPNGNIKRRLEDSPYWTIEINTLEELIALSEKYGEIILDGDSIEIYDDYRE
jgi:hypothetical protein